MGAGDGFGRDPIGRTPRGTVAVEASKAGRSPEGDAGGRAAGRRRSGAAGHRGVAVVEPDGRDEARAPGRGPGRAGRSGGRDQQGRRAGHVWVGGCTVFAAMVTSGMRGREEEAGGLTEGA